MKRTILTTTIAETMAADLEAFEHFDKESKKISREIVKAKKNSEVTKRLKKKV